MSQRFFRCRLCGIPHELDTVICPVVNQPIPVQKTLLPGGGGAAEAVAAIGTADLVLPKLPRVPLVPKESTVPGFPPPPLPPSTVDVAETPARATSSRPPSRPASTMAGSVIDGRYRVESVIAEGGMGVVYGAVHLELGRRVAIKALARKFAEDNVAVTRFRNEGRAAGGLGHPNIVEVFDMGTLPNGAPYLVMERLDGETLGERLKHERVLPIADAGNITQQILSALSATHVRNIVHRDLKPENVFLSSRAGLPPVVKLLDFGISKQVRRHDDDNLSLTRAGFVMGTPTYMAPEQARGERDLDGRVDLYAVGVLAYEMLIGKPPYAAKTPAALVVEMKQTRPAPPRTLRPEIAVGLDAILMRLLALDRTKRFATAGEALDALTGMGPWEDTPDTAETTLRVTASATGADPDASQNVQLFSWAEKPK